jgi:hypothetical protein
MYKLPAIIFVFFPLLAFVIAGATELRTSRAIGDLLRRVGPAVLGIATLYVAVYPRTVGVVTPEGSEALSHLLVMVAAFVACSGVFISYSRRSSGIWIALGGLTLIFVSLYSRIYY